MDGEARNALAYRIMFDNSFRNAAFGKPRYNWKNTSFTLGLGRNGWSGEEPDWTGT
jgi:hypothetical protein